MESITVRVPAEKLPRFRRYAYRVAEKSADPLPVLIWLDSLPAVTTREEVLSGLFRFKPSQIEAAFSFDKPNLKCSEWIDLRIDCKFDPATFWHTCSVSIDTSKCYESSKDGKLAEFGASDDAWSISRDLIIDHVVHTVIKSVTEEIG